MYVPSIRNNAHRLAACSLSRRALVGSLLAYRDRVSIIRRYRSCGTCRPINCHDQCNYREFHRRNFDHVKITLIVRRDVITCSRSASTSACAIHRRVQMWPKKGSNDRQKEETEEKRKSGILVAESRRIDVRLL